MKALCHREGLLAACQIAGAAIPAKDLKPILKNLKAVAGDGRCTLIATDLEVGIRLDVQGLTIQEPGEAILPAAKLIAILRESRDGELAIEADSSACVVKGAQFEFEMPSEDPAQFPDFPNFSDDRYHEITAGTLREMIRRTVFATADETARYSMTGVMWELDGDLIRLVATDGRRLALSEGIATPTGGHTTKGQTPVVPTKAMALLERNLQDDAEETVKVCLRPNEVLFRTGRAVIYSRLVEGRFPDYRAVLPKKKTETLTLNAQAFQSAVRQAAIMTDTDNKRVTFKFGPGKLTLLAQGATAGRSRIEMPLEYGGKGIDINFNPEYLTDMLKVLPADAPLTADLIDGASPALFRCGTTYSYLVMPLT
ncbi:MAG: DNA polymerase III subunit beta [Gemmataceae bacterium]